MDKNKQKKFVTPVHDKIEEEFKKKGCSATLLGILVKMSDRKLKDIFMYS